MVRSGSRCSLSARHRLQSLVKEGYTFDVAYTSVLKRAIKTLAIVQDEMNLDWIPVHRHWYAICDAASSGLRLTSLPGASTSVIMVLSRA